MKLDLTDLPIGEGGLSPESIEEFWLESRESFEVYGREAFRHDQSVLIDRAYYNDVGSIITDRGKEVAMLMPIAFAKVALAVVNLLESDRVLAAIKSAKAEDLKGAVSLEVAWDEEFGEPLPDAKENVAAAAKG